MRADGTKAGVPASPHTTGSFGGQFTADRSPPRARNVRGGAPAPCALRLAGRSISGFCQFYERVEQGAVEPGSRAKEAVGLEGVEGGDGAPQGIGGRADHGT